MTKIRTCVNCRKKDVKENLIRFANLSNIEIDYDQNISARGMYICNNEECIRNLKKRILNNKFKYNIDLDKNKLVILLDQLLEGMEK